MSGAPPSVHLCDWPVADEALIDEELAAATALAMRLARLGRSARAAADLRVRQPLAEVVVDLATARERAALAVIESQLLDELNVKRVRLADEVGGLQAAQVKPNYKALGPRFGRQMKQVAAAIAAADPEKLAAQAAAGGAVTVGHFELQADDLIVETVPREEYAIASEPGCQVGVLKELTDELRAEGMVREAVHLINNLRRESGFDIADRITLYLTAAGPVQSALRTHEALLAAEVLATDLQYDADLPEDTFTAKGVISGHPITIGVERAGIG